MTLIGAVLPILLSALTSGPPSLATQDSAAVVRRVAATATLAAQEYRIGVVDGRIVAAATPEDVVAAGTHTGKALAPVLAR